MSATITIDKIRAKFPDPRGAHQQEPRAGGYCVGGALYYTACPELLGMGLLGFPNEQIIAETLLSLNPALPRASSELIADRIVLANDDGRFEDAWRYADEALRYGGES